MVEVYERAGLLHPFMLELLRPRLAESAATWQRLHDRDASVAFTLLSRTPAGLRQGAISGVRAWDQTWLVQHFGVLPGADFGVAPLLELGCLGSALARPDTRHVSFFINTKNAVMNAALEKFSSVAETVDMLSRVEFALWTSSAGAAMQPLQRLGYACRPVAPGEEVLASHIAERVLGGMTAGALAIAPGALELAETSESFARLGLTRKRAAYLLWDRARVRALLLKEETSAGVNLTGVLDAWWLLPVDRGPEVDATTLAAAAAAIKNLESAPLAQHTLLLIPGGVPCEPLAAAGFEKRLDAYFYTLNRAGVARFHANLATRYDEVRALVNRRAARGPRKKRSAATAPAYAVAQFRNPEAEIARLAEQARVIADAEEEVFSSLGLPYEGRVLDVGCGPGFVAARLQATRPGLRIIGVDRDPSVLERARTCIEAVHGDAEQLPFAANEFQCAYARLVLRHLYRPEAALAEMFRVIAPGGCVIVLDSDDDALVLHPEPAGFDRVLVAGQLSARRRGADPFLGRRLPALLRQAGFAGIRARTLSVDSLSLGTAAFAQIVLSPVADRVDADLLSAEAVSAVATALSAWVANIDAFGMTTALAIGAYKPVPGSSV